ncbi:MAG: hypothetical protein NG747_14700 [Candidatus Brocadia sp.]|nr:hypothetical protein [Candidatus Brocadia sp.]
MSYFSIKKTLLWLSIASLLYISGCATFEIKEGVFSPSNGKYTVSMPGKGWEPLKIGKEDIVLWYKQHHAMIAIISSEIENKGLSLEMLNRHLFLGMTNKEIISKEPVLVDNQSALHTILEGKMDNNKLKFDAYIIKMGDTVYDLVYWAPCDSFEDVRSDFERMVMSFKFVKN